MTIRHAFLVLLFICFFGTFGTAHAQQTHLSTLSGYNIYSPEMQKLSINGGTNDLYMFFGGWNTSSVVTNEFGADHIYRAKCTGPFGACDPNSVVDVISHQKYATTTDGLYIYQVNDPSIVDIVNPWGSYKAMYMTLVGCSNPGLQNCQSVVLGTGGVGTWRRELYVSVSIDGGASWGQPFRLFPSFNLSPTDVTTLRNTYWGDATVQNGNVYFFGNSVIDGCIKRLSLGPFGSFATAVDSVRTQTPADFGIFCDLPGGGNNVGLTTNVDVMYRPSISLFQILIERFDTTSEAVAAQPSYIDYYDSANGLTWVERHKKIIVPVTGQIRVGAPAPHPDTHCWVYFKENPTSAPHPSMDFKIWRYDWCAGN